MSDRFGERTVGLQMVDIERGIPSRDRAARAGASDRARAGVSDRAARAGASSRDRAVRAGASGRASRDSASVRDRRSDGRSTQARSRSRSRRAWYIKRRNQLLRRMGLMVVGVVLAVVLVVKGVSILRGSGVEADNGQVENPDMLARNVSQEQQTSLVGEPDAQEPVIVLDAGHGGNDPGTMSQGVNEKEINLAITQKLQAILEAKGYHVILTREGDTAMSLEDRVRTAADARASVFVSIHQNALEKDTRTSGIQTYCCKASNPDSVKLVDAIHSRLLDATGATDRGSHYDSDFYVVLNNTMPACLVETGFLTSTAEWEKLTSDEYQDKLAGAVADGVVAFLENRV